MHIVYEKGFTPFKSPTFFFAAPARLPKYGDWLHLELLLHEEDFACYTVREGTKEINVFVMARADQDTELEETIRGESKIVKIPSCDAITKINVGSVCEGEDTAVKIKAVKGNVVLRSVIFE